MNRRNVPLAIVLTLIVAMAAAAWAASPGEDGGKTKGDFPRPLESYQDAHLENIPAILKNRIAAEPFNLVASLIFLCAIVHTFLASRFMALSHHWIHEHEKKIRRGEAREGSVHLGGEIMHFVGEVEVVFGLWALALMGAIFFFFDWVTVKGYIAGGGVNFTEPAFVVVIMTLAATRPILRLSESIMVGIAGVMGGSLAALWFTILTVGPVLGSFITEPAAITISAMLLSEFFYSLNPSMRFRYATLGVLFVNISVGGTFTHFAAPPVLMVAAPWEWTTPFMVQHFGWKALVGILIVNGLFYALFRGELASMQAKFAVRSLRNRVARSVVTRERIDEAFCRLEAEAERELGLLTALGETKDRLLDRIRARMEEEVLPELKADGVDPEVIRDVFHRRFEEVRLARMRRSFPALLPEDQRPPYRDPEWDRREDPVPWWVTVVHLVFMGWTIFTAHYPPLFVLGMLFFLGFAQATSPYQNRVNLKPAMLVGFFLAGLVIHGGVQGWWIAPVLGGLSEVPLMLGATILTAFNDNAAITYLSTLVPDFSDSSKYAVVAGAVAGGGLTVIANAPNPAGQAILKKHFNDAVSPLGLLAGAIVPTVILFLCYLYLP